MWDDKMPRRKVPLCELEKKVNDMYQVAGVTFISVAHRYLFRNVLTDTGTWQLFGKMVPSIMETAEFESAKRLSHRGAVWTRIASSKREVCAAHCLHRV